MEVQKTINYFQFKRIESNRPVDQKHVNSMVTKIQDKNLLHLFPILVNSAFEVIDGQHRLAAAEILQVYVYYIVDDTISKSDIANVNVLAKNWTVVDYINYYAVEGKSGFEQLAAFMIDNPLIPASTAMKMLHGSNTTAELKQGIINVSNYDQAVEIANILREYRNMIDWAYDRNFVLAVVVCFRTAGYDQEIMRRKLEFQSRSLVKCVSVRQYTEMLEEIYNYGSSKNRLKIVA